MHKFIFLITTSHIPKGPEFIKRRKIVYIRYGIVAKRLTVYETQNMKNICVEITVKKRNWGILFTYRPPNNNNLKLFFEETTQSVTQLLSELDNIIIAGDFNIDTDSKNCGKFKQFADFCHTCLT